MTELDKFGRIIAEDLRDSILNRYLDIETRHVIPEVQKRFSDELNEFNKEQKQFIRSLITAIVTSGIHDFLFALEEKREGIQVLIDGVDLADASDGLQGEIFTEDGWFERFSQHKEVGI